MRVPLPFSFGISLTWSHPELNRENRLLPLTCLPNHAHDTSHAASPGFPHHPPPPVFREIFQIAPFHASVSNRKFGSTTTLRSKPPYCSPRCRARVLSSVASRAPAFTMIRTASDVNCALARGRQLCKNRLNQRGRRNAIAVFRNAAKGLLAQWRFRATSADHHKSLQQEICDWRTGQDRYSRQLFRSTHCQASDAERLLRN